MIDGGSIVHQDINAPQYNVGANIYYRKCYHSWDVSEYE